MPIHNGPTSGLDLGKVVYRDYRLRGKALEGATDYKRYAFTPSGVSPFAVPGGSRHLVVEDSDEHDEEGHLTEDALIRMRMVQKRLLDKLPAIRKEIAPPALYGADRPETVVVGWGSTYGVLKEAIDSLPGRERIAFLHFSELFPFPGTDDSITWPCSGRRKGPSASRTTRHRSLRG